MRKATLPVTREGTITLGPPTFNGLIGSVSAVGGATSSIVLPVGLAFGLPVYAGGSTFHPGLGAITPVSEGASFVVP